MDDRQNIANTLINDLEKLKDCLIKERACLNEGSVDALKTIASDKNTLVTAINHQARKLLEHSNIASDPVNTPTSLAELLSSLGETENLNYLLELLNTCKTMNEYNGHAIAVQQNYMASLSDILFKKDIYSQTYTQEGVCETSPSKETALSEA